MLGIGSLRTYEKQKGLTKMSFKLSQRSLDKLEGVHPDMVKCVKSAIEWY